MTKNQIRASEAKQNLPEWVYIIKRLEEEARAELEEDSTIRDAMHKARNQKKPSQ